MTIEFAFASDPLDPRRADDMFEDQIAALRERDLTVRVCRWCAESPLW